MAGTVETMLTVTLSVKKSWWVKPFMWLAVVAVEPFAEVVDLDAYTSRIAGFIAKYGMKITVG